MPHSVPMPATGFQAFILCGPGASFDTFTSHPEENPKALIPIANRPMVWYPLDWCYRMGITDITLITPPSSSPPLLSALSQNPHLTSLPSAHRPEVLSPSGLDQTTGTAELLRLPEVQTAIQTDFVVLPCDLICELQGDELLEAWMVREGGLGGLGLGVGDKARDHTLIGMGGECGGRRGGLGVWYQTKDQGGVKKEEPDFLAISRLENDNAPVIPFLRRGTPRGNLWNLALSVPMSSLKDTMEEKKGLLIRHSLVRKHARLKMLTTYRDAHIYFFPLWVKELVMKNEKFESISEDLIGWWAKSEWQEGLGEKLGLQQVLEGSDENGETGSEDVNSIEEDIDLGQMSTTRTGLLRDKGEPNFASRVQDANAQKHESGLRKRKLAIPPILAYINPTSLTAPLIRRVDSSALLLSVSLLLAKLEAVEEAGSSASPFAHNQKISYPAGVPQRCTITQTDCLLADNVMVEEKCSIKESVIGANCQIATGARLMHCLLMDGVVVGEKCQLTGCILGRRSKIGMDCTLKDCEVQDGNVVPEGTEAKGEKFMVFDGLDVDDGDFGNGDEIDEEDSGLEIS